MNRTALPSLSIPVVEDAGRRLHRRDYLFLAGFCALLFGYSMIGGRPLTMHEAVLPQSAREMLATKDWLVPRCGGQPWLERPPLPQWITVATASLVGGCATEWQARLPANLAGLSVVLLTGMMGAAWFGRPVGLLAALCTATMFEIVSYAWLAEQDIFLCVLTTLSLGLFARLEITNPHVPAAARFFGRRSWEMIALFAALGGTHLVKGMIFGPAITLLPILGYFAWNRQRHRIRAFIWFWGFALTLAIAGIWPVAVLCRYPDVVELWSFDLVGRLDGSYSAITQPWWYYVATLPWEIAPWTLPALVGLWNSIVASRQGSARAEKFLLSWSLLPIVIFSLPSGKHHHYLLPVLPAWGILAALGLHRLWQSLREHDRQLIRGTLGLCLITLAALGCLGTKLPGPRGVLLAAMALALGSAGLFIRGICRHDGRWLMAGMLMIIVPCYAWIFSFVLPARDRCLEDTAFLAEVRRRARPGIPLTVNHDLQTADVFRNLFYLPASAIPLLNLTYLRDQRLAAERVQVVTRAEDERKLEALGEVRILAQSRYTRRETSPADRLTLFELRFRHDITRYPARDYVSPMQGMLRVPGPFLGKPL